VFYTSAGNICARSISPANPTSFTSETVISSVYSSPGQFAVINGGQYMILAFNSSGGTSVVGYLTTALTFVTQTTLSDGMVGGGCIVQTPDFNNQIWVATAGVTGSVNLFILNPSNLASAVTGGAIVVDNTAAISGSIRNLTGINLYNATTPGGVQFYYEVLTQAASHSNAYIQTTTVAFNGIAGPSSSFCRSVGLAGKAFTISQPQTTVTNTYIPCAHDSPLQSSYFLLRNDGVILAKYQMQQGGGLTAKSMLPTVIQEAAGIFKTPVLTKGQLDSIGGNVFTETGLTREVFNFDVPNSYRSEQVGQNLHIIGGFLGNYDGVSITEHNFHVFPEFITGSVSASISGSLLSGSTYSWVATYQWTDNVGNVYQSAPSQPFTVTTANSGAFNANIQIDTLRLTAKQGTRANAGIVLWRTQPLGNIYFRVTNPTGSIANNTQVDSVSIPDNLIDTTLAGNDELYTNGGIIPYAAPPAASLIAIWDGRVWLGGMEDPYALWYSNTFIPGQPVSFGNGFSVEVDAQGGPITALAVLDDSLVIFKKDRLFLLSGYGPTSLGTNNQFVGPELITSQTGCTNANSLVQAPASVYFSSNVGINRLSARGLLIDYLGAPVEGFNSQTITAATLIENATQVRFLCNDGDTLIYDYFYNLWYTHTYEGNDAIVWNGTYAYASTNGQVLVETPGSFQDINTPIKMVIETPWYKFAGVQGLVKCSETLVLGTYKSPHTLKVDIAYDYSTAYTDTEYINSDVLGDLPFGTISPYGAPGFAFGGNAPVMQYKIGMPRYTFSSVRFRFSDVETSSTGGTLEGYSLTGLSFKVGSMGRLQRVPIKQTV